MDGPLQEIPANWQSVKISSPGYVDQLWKVNQAQLTKYHKEIHQREAEIPRFEIGTKPNPPMFKFSFNQAQIVCTSWQIFDVANIFVQIRKYLFVPELGHCGRKKGW